MGCGASAPADKAEAVASPAPKPSASANAPPAPTPESPSAVVPLPDIKKPSPLGDLPDVQNASAKQQMTLDAEMEAVLNAEATVALKEEQRKEAQEVFTKFDMNGSGSIEVAEVHSILQKLGLTISEEQFEAYSGVLMKNYDKDRSGKLEYAEFERFYGKCLASENVRRRYANKLTRDAGGSFVKEAAKVAFEKYDADSSGYIEISELRTVLTEMLRLPLSDEQFDFFVEDTMKRGDKNDDNKFDYGEFLNLFKKCLADDKIREKFEDKIKLRYSAENGWTAE